MSASDIVIWKEVLQAKEVHRLDCPGIFRPLHIASQKDDTMCLWYECQPSADSSTIVELYVFPTGFVIPSEPSLTYIGTALMFSDDLVFHVYYRIIT